MADLRIKGLVRASNLVRSQLRSGVPADEVQQLRTEVASLVEDVEEMCARRGVTPEHLPAPSRNAYRFLRHLDLANLPFEDAARPSKTGSPLAINNLVRMRDDVADRLWREATAPSPSPRERSRLLTDIDERASEVDRICMEHDSAPSALAPPSKRAYCWLRFLSSRDRIDLHLSALGRMASAIPRRRGDDRSARVHMVNMGALWRARQYGDGVLASVNEGFLNAESTVCRAIALSCLNQGSSSSDRLIREFAESDDFGEVLFEMESFAEPEALDAQGRVHNLDQSFRRVNKAYFGVSLSRPRLVWNRTLTARKFGHYQQSLDTVMLSISLDDPGVSPDLIDFVMYHELLHKKHGAVMVDGRRLVHSRPFRAEERRFPDYDNAVKSLSDLARRYR